MPSRAPSGVTLGFIGTGAVKDATAEKLLVDLLEASGGALKFFFPVTEETWSDSMSFVYEFAVANEIPYEIVTDADSKTAKDFKKIVEGAAKTHVMARIVPKIVSLLEKAQNPQLLVFWSDKDDTVLPAAESAIEKGIEVRDLCDGLTKLELTDGAAGADAAGGEDEAKPYTQEELLALNEEDLRKLCEQAEIDPDEYKTWEEVVDLLLKFQDEEGGEAAAAGADDDTPYTRAELEAMDLDALKDIVKVNELEVPPRSRAKTYIEVILEAQGNADEGDGADEDAKTPSGRTEAAGAVPEGVLTVIETVQESLTLFADALKTLADTLDTKFDDVITKLDEMSEKLNDVEPEKPSGVVRKALVRRETPEPEAASSNGAGRGLRRVTR